MRLSNVRSGDASYGKGGCDVGHHPATNRRPRRRRLLVAGAAALAAVSAGASPAAARPPSLASRPTAVSRQSGPVARWVGAPAHGDRTPPLPERPATIVVNTTNLPTSVTESLALLETQLTALAHQLQGLPQGSSCCRPATG